VAQRALGGAVTDWPFPLWTFVPFLAALWLGVLHLLAGLGGWRRLASRYAAGTTPAGERFAFRSAFLGGVSYGACLRFTAGPGGLGLAVLTPFRPGHPPLFVPWPDLRAESERVLLVQRVRLTFAKAPGVTLRVSRRLARELARASRGALAIPEAV
jgi:hypothetical protein